MTNLAVICKEEDGVQFFTVESTGESGMSRSGLARLCGVDESSIRGILKNLVRGTVTADSLKSLLGKDLEFGEKVSYKNAAIIRDEICAGIIEYYAFDTQQPTEEAKFALRKFLRGGIQKWIHSVTGWKKSEDNLLEEPSDLTIECWIQEIVVDIVSSLFVEVANNISNVESITIQQKKQLRAEFQKGISREQLHAKAQKALGKIGHNAAHQYSSIIEVAAERAAPYLDIIFDRVQKALQCKSSPLVLPPASEPVVIKEYIRIGVPKTEATFIEQMEGIHEDLSTENWKSYGKNWIEYSQKRWNVSKTHGYRLRDAADIYARFKTAGVKPLPTNEHQIRELPRLSKEQQIEVWLKAVEIEGAEPSPAIVETLVEKYE